MLLYFHRNRRFIRDGGLGKREREGDYIPVRYTDTTRMTPSLRRAAMRAIQNDDHRFYIALLSALEHTQRAHDVCDSK